MKKIIFFLFTFLLVASLSFAVFAATYSGSFGENLNYNIDTIAGTLEITGTGEMENFNSHNEVPLYSTRSYVKSITISDGITSIGDHAFSDCYNLTSIVIPGSVTSIGDNAFYYCPSLESIVIPDGVTSIGSQAFTYCNALESIVIPDSVTSMGYYVFYGISPFILCNRGSYADTYAKDNNMNVHYFQHEVTKTSTTVTCISDGIAQYVCNECSYTYSDVDAALGHDYIYHEGKGPTETESGWKAYETCSRCDYTSYEELPAANLKADFNGDGEISLNDVLILVDAILDGQLLENGDMNGDGKLSLADILCVLKLSVQ